MQRECDKERRGRKRTVERIGGESKRRKLGAGKVSVGNEKGNIG